MDVVKCQFGNLLFGAQPVWDADIASAKNSMNIHHLHRSMYEPTFVENFMQAYDAWIKSSKINRIKGLKLRKYYMTFAVTHAIEQFLMKYRKCRIRTFRGEYPGTLELIKGYDLKHKDINDSSISSGDAVIISAPFSGSGNIHPYTNNILEECTQKGVPVMIDSAFYGICGNLRLTLLPCVETIAFSLSKCYGLQSQRVGMIYSFAPPVGIEVLQRFNYVARFGASVAMELFPRFSSDYIYNKYSPLQKIVCRELGDMTPSDTVLFGNGGEKWKQFERAEGMNRVSFAEFLPTVETQIYEPNVIS